MPKYCPAYTITDFGPSFTYFFPLQANFFPNISSFLPYFCIAGRINILSVPQQYEML